MSSPSEPADTIRLSAPSDQILGWGLGADDSPLVFSSQHGLLRLTARGASAADSSQMYVVCALLCSLDRA